MGMNIVDPSKREFLKKAGLGAGLLAVGPGVLAACGDDDSSSAGTTTTTTTAAAAPSLTKVGFQLGWVPSVQYGGSFIAQERGYYTDEGLEVEIFPGGPNNPVDPTIVSGQALIGVGATDYAARANLEGAGYKIIGSKNQSHAFCITSLADNPVENPQALEGGARIGVATINQPVIDAIVALNDLDASLLNIVPTQGDPAPLINGEVDCFLTLFTTGPIDLELQGFETSSWLLGEYGYQIFAGVNMVLEETLNDPEKRDLTKRLFKADLRGWHDWVDDIQYATDITVNKYAADQDLNPEQQFLQAEAQRDLLVTPETEANGLFTMSAEKIAQNIETMSLLGVEIDESLFVTDLLDEIYAEGF
jgi:NitT/TauT family transport system substrate-binding protein